MDRSYSNKLGLSLHLQKATPKLAGSKKSNLKESKKCITGRTTFSPGSDFSLNEAEEKRKKHFVGGFNW